MFERFSGGARRVVVLAQQEARELRQRRIGTQHLLLGMLDERTGIAAGVLRAAAVTAEGVRERVREVSVEPLGEVDAEALKSIGIDLDAVRRAVEGAFGPGALDAVPCEPPRGRWLRRKQDPMPKGHIPFSPRAKKVLELSLREALALHHSYIGSEHMLLGLIREGEGLGVKVLVDLGVDLGYLRGRTLEALKTAA